MRSRSTCTACAGSSRAATPPSSRCAGSATCCGPSTMAHSLRGRLLAWVMLPLAGAVVFDGVVSRQNAEATAAVVQDRLLLGSARIVAEDLRFEDGVIADPI